MTMETDEKIYLTPGTLVTIKHEIPNKPEVMWVVRKSQMTIKKDNSNNFLGMVCRWFDKNQCLQEATFSTKDLIKL